MNKYDKLKYELIDQLLNVHSSAQVVGFNEQKMDDYVSLIINSELITKDVVSLRAFIAGYHQCLKHFMIADKMTYGGIYDGEFWPEDIAKSKNIKLFNVGFYWTVGASKPSFFAKKLTSSVLFKEKRDRNESSNC